MGPCAEAVVTVKKAAAYEAEVEVEAGYATFNSCSHRLSFTFLRLNERFVIRTPV